jgi:hypothetical protein
MCGFYCFCYMNYGLDVEIQEGKTLHMHSLFQGPVDLTVRFLKVDFTKNTIKFLSVKACELSHARPAHLPIYGVHS